MAKRDRMWFRLADDAVAGAPQGRIHAKNHTVGRGRRPQAGCQKRRRGTRGRAAEALLHLFELLPGNAHARILPAVEKMRKQKAL